MPEGDGTTLRLIRPQWQGGDLADYHFGTEVLAWLAPPTSGPVEVVPEPLPLPVWALSVTFGGSCFTAREAWQRAADGEAPADLWRAFQEVGIDGTRSLGFHLGRLEAEGAGIRRGGLQHNTNTWEVLAWARRA